MSIGQGRGLVLATKKNEVDWKIRVSILYKNANLKG